MRQVPRPFGLGVGALALLVLSLPSWSQTPAPAPSLKTLGIAEVKLMPALVESVSDAGKLNSFRRVAEAMDGNLIDRLHNSRKFTIVSRSDLDRVLKEQDFGGSGMVDASDAKGAKPFKLKGVEYLVVCSIDDFQDQTETMVLGALGEKLTKRTISLSAVTKIYDTTSGKLLESANIQLGNKELQEGVAKDAAIQSDGAIGDQLLVAAARIMAQRVADRVVDVLYPARIIGLIGDQATINRGDGSGIAVGQHWKVYALGEEMIDPDTGGSLGREEVNVGTLEVTEVTPKFSKGRVTENNGVEKLQVVRPLPPPVTPPAAK